MTTSDKLILKYGDPTIDKSFEKRHMGLFNYSLDIREAIPSLGKSIYCNKDLYPVLEKTYRALIEKGLHTEIKTNDECFCIRMIRGYTDQLSTHSWGMAVDLNVVDNPLGVTKEEALEKGLSPFTDRFVQVWRDNGWICGWDFKNRKDGMHFELTKNL
jgi:hypothetical protein